MNLLQRSLPQHRIVLEPTLYPPRTLMRIATFLICTRVLAAV